MAKYASSERTREAIITATGELVAERGFDNVSIRAIANRSNTNVGSIHYHFGSKEKLFEAVLIYVIDWIWGRYFEGIFDEIDLTTAQGRSVAIRKLAQAHMEGIFQDEKPYWYNKVLFEAVGSESFLDDIIIEEFVSRDMELMDQIRVGEGHERPVSMYVVYHILAGVCVFHSNFKGIIIKSMKLQEYPKEYQTILEDMIVELLEKHFGEEPNKGK